MANDARALYLNAGRQTQLQSDDTLLANALDILGSPVSVSLFSDAGSYAVNLFTGTTGDVTIASAATGTVAMGAAAATVTVGAAATTVNLGSAAGKVDIIGDLEVSGDETIIGSSVFETDVTFGDATLPATTVTFNSDSTTLFVTGAVVGNGTYSEMVFDTATAAQSITGNGTNALTLTNDGGGLNLTTTTSGALAVNSVGAVSVDSGSTMAFTATSGTTSFTCTGQSFTVDGAGISLDGTAASNFTTSAGNALTLTSGDSATWGTSAGTLLLQSNGQLTTNTVAGNAIYRSSTTYTTTLLSAGANGLTQIQSGTGGIDITGSGTVDITTDIAATDINVAPANNGSVSVTTIGSGTVDITSASTINIDSSAAGVTVEGGAASSFTTTAGNLSLTAASILNMDGASATLDTSSGSIAMNSATTIAMTATTAVNINSTGANDINLSPGSSIVDIVTTNASQVMALDTTGSTAAAGIFVSDAAPSGTPGEGSLWLRTASDAGELYMYAGVTDGWTLFTTSTGSTLQAAYIAGNTITTSAGEGNVIIAGTEKLNVTATNGIDLDTVFDFDGTSFDVQMTGTNGFSIDGTAASNVTVNAGDLTLATTTSGNVVLSATGGGVVQVSSGALDVNTSIDADVTTADVSASGAISLAAGAASQFTTSVGNLTLTTTDVDGDVIVTAGTTSGIVNVDGYSVDIDGGGGGVSIDGAAASNFSTSAGGITINANTTLDMDAAGDATIDADDILLTSTGTSAANQVSIAASGAGAVNIQTAGAGNVRINPLTGYVNIETNTVNRAIRIRTDESGTTNDASIYVDDTDPDGILSATAGSILLDTNGLLHYCEGGTTWQQVAADADITLQGAYSNVSGNTIVTGSSTAIDFTLTSGAFLVTTSSGNDVQFDNGTNNYLKTAHADSQLALGAGGATVTVGFLGYVDTGITFEGAQTLQTSSGVLSLTGAGGVTTTATAGAVTLTSSAANVDINASTGVTIDGSTLTTGSGGAMGHVLGATTFDLNASGAITIDSSASTISIGADDVDQAINIGTSGERAIEIGNSAAPGASSILITGGTGGAALEAYGATGNVSLYGEDASNFTMAATNAVAKTLTISASNAGAGTGNVLVIADDAITFDGNGMSTPLPLNGTTSGDTGDQDLATTFANSTIVGCLNELKNASADIRLTIAAGETMTKGSAVYISTADGYAYRADADASVSTARFVGFTADDVTVTVPGDTDVDVFLAGEAVVNSNLSGDLKGEYVYLDTSAGLVSTTPPGTGTVLRVGVITNNAVAGTARVAIQIGEPVQL